MKSIDLWDGRDYPVEYLKSAFPALYQYRKLSDTLYSKPDIGYETLMEHSSRRNTFITSVIVASVFALAGLTAPAIREHSYLVVLVWMCAFVGSFMLCTLNATIHNIKRAYTAPLVSIKHGIATISSYRKQGCYRSFLIYQKILASVPAHLTLTTIPTSETQELREEVILLDVTDIYENIIQVVSAKYIVSDGGAHKRVYMRCYVDSSVIGVWKAFCELLMVTPRKND